MTSDHIHWSFQYDGRSQTPHFGKQLIEILNRGTTPASEKKYTVLPNYWKGYKGRGSGEAHARPDDWRSNNQPKARDHRKTGITTFNFSTPQAVKICTSTFILRTTTSAPCGIPGA